MKKLLAFLLLGMFLISFSSAWTSSEFTRDEIKSLDKLTNFGTYEIKESAWYDPLKIFTEETIKSIELKTNTEQCVDCLSEGTIVLNKDGTLIDDFIWRRSFDNGKTFVDWKGYTNWKLLVEEDVDVFETTCVNGKEIIDEKNGTSYFEQDCTTSKTGTTKQWNVLDFKKEYKAGTYNYKIEGSKKASVIYDWIIKTNGELLTNWAVWGAVIGVGGVEANVTLNSPANNSIQYTKSVTTNATANVTNGAYLVNASLNLSVNGGAWEIRNTSILGGASNYVSENTPGTWTENTFSTSQDGIKILTKNNVLVYNVTKRSYSGATSARILDASKNVIATASFSGNIATFSTPVELSNNTNYFIATWNNGNNYDIAYSSATSYSGTYYNFVEGLRGNNPNPNMIEIVSVGMASYNFPTTLTVLYTNTFNAGDVVDFNYEFCDSDGDCGFATSNYTFSIDSTAPTITLNYPTSLINYGAVNQTLQLNFTATDTNLDKVWYNYNGTNVTIAGAVSGVYNISNITLSTKKNVTIYANDTAGNLNATTFNWDYKVFENGRSFVNETYARVSNNFLINITSINSTSIVLNYNGINYSTNTYYSGTSVISSVSVLSPIVTQDTNVSFYWIITMNDENIIQTTQNNQTVVYLTIGNTYSNLIYNITLKNENTNTLIPNNNVTMAYSIDYGFDINSILGTANFNDNKLLNKNISSNIFSQLYLAGDIIFSATDFIGRNYYFIENNISSPKNVTLYLSYENESYVKSIIVTDEGGRGVPALFEQYRNINGVDVLLASEVLDQTGKSNIVFTPNVQYTFKFYSDTCQNATKNIMFYDQTDYTQVLSCSSYNPDDWIDEFKDMFVSFSPNGLFYVDNDTEDDDSAFFANVSGSSEFCDSINTIVFNIYNSTGALIGSDTANGCDVLSDSAYFDLFATATLYILLDSGEEQTLGFRWQKLYSNKDYSGYNILDLLQEVGESEDILGIDWKFKLLFCFIGLFGIIIALTAYQRIYNFSNTATLIICDAYIWFMCFIGWGSLDFGKVGGGFTTFISQYALFILAVVGTVGVLSNKEDEYS